jgi:hypothetical protein
MLNKNPGKHWAKRLDSIFDRVQLNPKAVRLRRLNTFATFVPNLSLAYLMTLQGTLESVVFQPK